MNYKIIETEFNRLYGVNIQSERVIIFISFDKKNSRKKSYHKNSEISLIITIRRKTK